MLPWIRYSDRALKRFVRRVTAPVARPPRNARLRLAVTKFTVRRGRAGYDIDRRRLRVRVERTLRGPGASRTLRVKRRRVHPAVTREDVLKRNPIVVTVHRGGFRLRVFRRGRRVASYRVAVGMAGHRTPRGRFRIVNKAQNPAWSAPLNGALARHRRGRRDPW